jgi:hypothetical protein
MIKLVTTAEYKRGNKMNYKAIRLNLWAILAVCIAVVCFQILSVNEVYAKGDIILQAEINNPEIQKCGNSYSLNLPTKLRMTNKTDKNLLLIRDAVHIVGFETAKSESDFEKEIYISQRFTLPGSIQKNLLNLQSLTKDRTEIIPPTGYYEWKSDGGYGFSRTTDDQSYGLPALSLEKLQSVDHLWIKYHIAFFPMNAMEDEGNKLQRNWEKFGYLLLDTKITQPIKIIIPKEVQEINGSCN